MAGASASIDPAIALENPPGSRNLPPVRVYQETIEVQSRGRGFINLGAAVANVVQRSQVTTGICQVFLQHTSASLVIQENADPTVLSDLEKWMGELAPESRAWEHDDEGPDDMPAHARAALTRTSESIPVTGGTLGFGTWQTVYLWEHRRRPHLRRLLITILGSS